MLQPVIDQLDSHGVPGDDEALFVHIPDGQAKHPIQATENLRSPLLVPMDNHLGVRVCSKCMTTSQQIGANFLEIVNLAIENHPDLLLKVRHRLMTSGQINDRKTPEAESERTVKIVPLVIRAAVYD